MISEQKETKKPRNQENQENPENNKPTKTKKQFLAEKIDATKTPTRQTSERHI